jgi:lipoate-protein ligase A
MTETWRLLIDDFADGAANMARDEAIAAVHASGATPPMLRLYRWRPACLSLGRFQRSAAIDRAACARADIQVVRRPSGGRALLHDDELTYAVIARTDHPLISGGSVVDSYRQISAALLAGLRQLGVAAELTPARRRAEQQLTESQTRDNRQETGEETHPVSRLLSPSLSGGRWSVPALPFDKLRNRAGEGVGGQWSAACFDAPSSYELTVDGRKLVGSAQTRRDGVLLQHGAIPLTPHAERLAMLLADPPTDLDQKMIALDQALGRKINFDELADALIAGFAETWRITFERGVLTAQEREWEGQLWASKYTDDGWTFAR